MLSSPVAADGIGSAIGGASGIGRGVGEQNGIITPAKLNQIALSATSILAGSANGSTLGTADGRQYHSDYDQCQRCEPDGAGRKLCHQRDWHRQPHFGQYRIGAAG